MGNFMIKKALNIQIDEKLYEEIRTISFIKRISIAGVVRDFLKAGIDGQKKPIKEKVSLVLDASDEKEILDILAKDEWISEEEFMKENNL